MKIEHDANKNNIKYESENKYNKYARKSDSQNWKHAFQKSV